MKSTQPIPRSPRPSPNARPTTQGLALAAALLAFAPLGCGTRPGGRGAAVRVVLLDTSPSTHKSAIGKLYRGSLHRVVASANSGDVLAVARVSNNSQATAYDDFSVQIPSYSPLAENEDQYGEAVRAARSRAEADALRMLAARDTGDGTDLLSAIASAAAVFSGSRYRAAPEKDLIIMSDGYQQTGDLDVTAERLTPGRIASILHRLRADGELPRLPGVKVWMVGCGADPNAQIGPEKIGQVRRFWMAYFQAAGASLAPDRCAASLRDYP